MEIKTKTIVKCPGCNRVDRKYHAKGMCKACYIKEWRLKKKMKQKVG